jgi:hypothetical protein
MTNCTTDADCILPTSWCTLSVTCDTVLGTCVAWPRCRTAPWLGCSKTSERCVTSNLEPVVTLEETTPRISAGFIVLILSFVVLGALVVFGAAYLYYARPSRRNKRVENEVTEEIEHMDLVADSTTTIHHPVLG